MYILKNAWKSIVRNKGRNVLIFVIALVISVSACVALSIREAAQNAREETLSGMSVTAQISFDRTSAMSNMRNDMAAQSGEAPEASAEGGKQFDRGSFDFSALSSSSLTLEDYMTYTSALSDGDSYYYTLSASLNASGEILPYGEEETDTADAGEAAASQMPGGGKMDMFFAASSGDFSVIGYSSYDGMLSLFGEGGTHSITDGSMFSEATDDASCVISDELAMYNDLKVGDTLTLQNPDCESETYDFYICGIYTNTASGEGNSRFSFSDPANSIYVSAETVEKICDASDAAGNTSTDSEGNETDAALSPETAFTYVFPDTDSYYAFETAVGDIGLPDGYAVSSADITAFENSLTPLNTLSNVAFWFFIVVLCVGGVILVVVNIFSLRERKYEVGVLCAIGMKKHSVAVQFMAELLIITFAAVIIGAAVGATASVPVTNRLLENQISSSETSGENVAQNFGFGGEGGDRFTKGEAVTPSYVDSVTSATDVTVILELSAVGLLLTLVSSLAAMVMIMRYEPLEILSSRS